MKKPPPKNTDAEVASRLEGLFEQVPLDPREIEETLREVGIDAKSATERMMARVLELQEHERRERLAQADAERKAEAVRHQSKRGGTSLRNRAEMLARFFEIRTQHPAAAAMFRDFQSASDEDLRSLLDDLEELIASGDS